MAGNEDCIYDWDEIEND